MPASSTHDIISGLLAVIDGLAEQQAMPDDSHLTEASVQAARGWLGEPTHIGDTIQIKATHPKGDESWRSESYDPETRLSTYRDDVPEGMVRTINRDTYEHPETGDPTPFSYASYIYPEAGEARYITEAEWNGGFVVTINDHRYRVDIHVLGTEDDIPNMGKVIFTRTDDVETEFQRWDHAEALVAYRAREVEGLAHTRAELVRAEAAGDESWANFERADIKRSEEQIAQIDAGKMELAHRFYAQVFGQPNFIQNNIFPVFNGRSAMALCSIETGWGDSGNINILFACDDNGVPCRVWFEASCC